MKRFFSTPFIFIIIIELIFLVLISYLLIPGLRSGTDKLLLVIFIATFSVVIGALTAFKNFLDFRKDEKELQASTLLGNSIDQSNLAEDKYTTIRKNPATNQGKDAIMLEYRVTVLENIISWMLNNGKFVKNISPTEMEQIHNKALDFVRRKYPEAEIKFDGRWQR